MKKRRFLLVPVTIVTLAALMVLNVVGRWTDEEFFAPPVIALILIFAVLCAGRKKKILSVISIIAAGGATCLCLGGATVALTWGGCDWIEWINLVNVVWYGCFSFVSMGVVIRNCFPEEKHTKTSRFVAFILFTPMVLYFSRFLTGRLWESYFESYLVSMLLNWIIEEILAVLTVFGIVKKKKALSIIALALGSMRTLGILWSLIQFLAFMRYYTMRYFTEVVLLMFLEYIFILVFCLSIIIVNCKFLAKNRTRQISLEATCLQCGNVLVPGKKFCIHCGAKISTENEEQKME